MAIFTQAFGDWLQAPMCRLFGFRSVIPSQVHRSLLAAENALGVQSNAHPDGWGVAYYIDGSPHLTKSPLTAVGDVLFHRLSGVVSSETVLAHVRKATQGAKTIINCHPFQYGRWVFAHNGDIPNFSLCREALLAEVSPGLRRFILGDTDSEVVFFVFLSRLQALGPLSRRYSTEEVSQSLANALSAVRRVAARPELQLPRVNADGSENTASTAPCELTVIVTDGETLVATHGGRGLFLSTYKRRCPDRDECPSLSGACEAPTEVGHVNHLILSSEPLQGENVWEPLNPGDMVGVDWRMRLMRSHVDQLRLPVLN